MKSYIKNLKSNFAVHQGFTLPELLLSMVIMSTVVALAGSALVAIIQQNQTVKSESERRTNLTSALNYIANEIRTSRNVQTTGSITDGFMFGAFNMNLPGLTLPTDTTGVIRLDISSESGDSFHNVYYLADSTNLWESPKSIMRATGSYNYLTGGTVNADDGKFLVDGIKAPTSATVTAITSNCTTNGGKFYGSDGFYACIYERRNASQYLIGDRVDLYLYGKVSDDNNEIIEVKSTVAIRAID